MILPETFASEHELENLLAEPYPETVALMRRLPGDIMILGVGGKMGPSLARLAYRAAQEAGVRKRIFGVSRFSEPEQRKALDDAGIETIACDLAEPEGVAALPEVENILYLAGRKFGARGSEALTWILNTIAPAQVARRCANSRVVAFSTGCVYPLVAPASGGCRESDPPAPIGEYANSCMGRERIFDYYSRRLGFPLLHFRLNYAVEPRYGVLVDIARQVLRDEPVNCGVPAVNVIWQGDANNRALLALEKAAAPPEILNVTGPEILSVADLARQFGELLNKPIRLRGTPGETCYLSNAARSVEWFGPPRVPVSTLLRWTVDWLRRGGKQLDKPTHFQVTDGQFLD